MSPVEHKIRRLKAEFNKSNLELVASNKALEARLVKLEQQLEKLDADKKRDAGNWPTH